MHADILWDTKPLKLDLKTLLKFEPTTRRRLPAFFIILMLAFAVSSWGLQYKLSLYHSLGPRHSMPAAKLLSQKERVVASTHLEKLRFSSRPYPSSTRSAFPDGVAELPDTENLIAAQWPEEDYVSSLDVPPLRLRHVSRISPRAPPPT